MSGRRSERDTRNRRDTVVSEEHEPGALALPAYLPVQQDSFDEMLAGRSGVAEGFMDARARRLLVKTLALVRKAKGVSQTELAQKMKTSQSAISDLEKGLKDPRLSTLQRIARALNLELQVSISAGPGLTLQSWNHRNVSYLSSVQPTRIEEGLEELWNAMLRQRREAAGCDLSIPEDAHVRPISSRDPRDDNYLSGADLRNLSISQAAIAEVATIG